MRQNNQRTREWLSREELASPTALTEGTFLTALFDTWEQQDTMTTDTSNAFMQAKLNGQKGKARVICENHRSVSGTINEEGATHT